PGRHTPFRPRHLARVDRTASEKISGEISGDVSIRRPPRSTLWCEGRRGPGNEEHTMSKYMLIWRPTDDALATMAETPFEEMLDKVGRYNDELIRAGVLLAAEGLDDPAESV